MFQAIRRRFFRPKTESVPPLCMEPTKKADIERDNYLAIARAQTELLSEQLDDLYQREREVVSERHRRGYH